MVRRLTKEELLNRVNYLWEKFHNRPEMQNICYEDFKQECLAEFQKQQQMPDEELDNYRKKCYNNLIKETKKLTTQQERESLNKQDNQTITIQDEMKFNSGVRMVNGDSEKV